MSAMFKTQPASLDAHTAEPPRRGPVRPHLWLEWGAGAFAFALAIAAMLLFMMSTIADRVDALIEAQNATALKLSADLHYYDSHRAPNDESIPPGVFSNLVEFARNTAIIIDEVHRLLAVEYVSTLGVGGTLDTPDGHLPWSDALLQNLKPKDGTSTKFDHTGVDPRTTGKTIVEAGAYQIELYQALRDFSQEKCTSYKDVGGAISTYLFPLLYALLGAGLCDLRGRVPGAGRRFASLGSARYTTAIIAGAVIGIFTSLVPTSLSLPPLLIAFLLGYSVDVFTARLDGLIDKLRKPGGDT
ncbi:MAG TPA: hypothetical protein VMB34_26570 [Acetobacteraceae bacterium]|nr:hypothetical protein [Acetobacteraceae bacterium]